jgi:hypothetical protein
MGAVVVEKKNILLFAKFREGVDSCLSHFLQNIVVPVMGEKIRDCWSNGLVTIIIILISLDIWLITTITPSS